MRSNILGYIPQQSLVGHGMGLFFLSFLPLWWVLEQAAKTDDKTIKTDNMKVIFFFKIFVVIIGCYKYNAFTEGLFLILSINSHE